MLNKIFDDGKTFGRHLVFSTSRISANILLVASQSDCGILSIFGKFFRRSDWLRAKGEIVISAL